MKNIDFIYMINLDQRPEKFEASLKQLKPYGITPCRFSAVNGWELSLETINDVGLKYENWMRKDVMGTAYLPENKGVAIHEKVHVPGRTYFSHCLSKGAIGIVLSHMSILQDAYDSGYETIWVMEDDIEVISDPHQISNLIEELDNFLGKNGWDILFTDQDTRNNNGDYVPCLGFALRPNFSPDQPQKFAKRTIVHNHFKKIGARYGAYSMILRRSGIKKILNFIKSYKVFLPYDMDFYLPSTIRMYTVRKDIVSTRLGSPSDNGGPNYKKTQLIQPIDDSEKNNE